MIYGAIVGLALFVALEPHPPAAATVAVILVTTAVAVAVALAELYSNVVGTRVRVHGPLGKARRPDAARDVVAVAAGVAFPALFFMLSAAGAIELDMAFDLAKWSGVGLLGWRSRCRWQRWRWPARALGCVPPCEDEAPGVPSHQETVVRA